MGGGVYQHQQDRHLWRTSWRWLMSKLHRTQAAVPRWSSLHTRCFLLTFLAHMCIQLVIKPLSVIKNDISFSSNWSLPQLGWLDFSFLLPFAITQLLVTKQINRSSPRKLIGYTLIAGGVLMIVFGWSTSYLAYMTLLFATGACFSVIMPACIKALSIWHTGRGEATQLGIWGSSLFLGQVVGAAVAVWMRGAYGWKSVFVLPSLFTIIVGIITARTLRMPSSLTMATASSSAHHARPHMHVPFAKGATPTSIANDAQLARKAAIGGALIDNPKASAKSKGFGGPTTPSKHHQHHRRSPPPHNQLSWTRQRPHAYDHPLSYDKQHTPSPSPPPAPLQSPPPPRKLNFGAQRDEAVLSLGRDGTLPYEDFDNMPVDGVIKNTAARNAIHEGKWRGLDDDSGPLVSSQLPSTAAKEGESTTAMITVSHTPQQPLQHSSTKAMANTTGTATATANVLQHSKAPGLGSARARSSSNGSLPYPAERLADLETTSTGESPPTADVDGAQALHFQSQAAAYDTDSEGSTVPSPTRHHSVVSNLQTASPTASAMFPEAAKSALVSQAQQAQEKLQNFFLQADGFLAGDFSLSTDDSEYESDTDVVYVEPLHRSRTLSLRETFQLPYLRSLGFTYLFVNMARFTIHMWMPYYFQSLHDYNRIAAGYLGSVFELGGLLGAVSISFIGERILHTGKVHMCHLALLIAAFATFLFHLTAGLGLFFQIICLVTMGAGFGGAEVLISTSIAISVGIDSDCVTSVSGLINCYGTLGAVLQAPLVALTVRHKGATGGVALISAMVLMPVLSLLPARPLDKRLGAGVTKRDMEA